MLYVSADSDATQSSDALLPGNPWHSLDFDGMCGGVAAARAPASQRKEQRPVVTRNHCSAVPRLLVRPFRCQYCPVSFASEFDLGRHERIHTGERPFFCTHCSASFSRKDHLVVHLRRHTGERPFKCGRCTKAFARTDHLRQHVRNHHP